MPAVPSTRKTPAARGPSPRIVSLDERASSTRRKHEATVQRTAARKNGGNRRARASRWPESFPTTPRSREAPRRRGFDSFRTPAYDSPRVMADYILESRVWLARARPEVFAFFAESANLVLLTPPSFRLRVVARPQALSTGAVVDLRLSWLGVPVRWRTFIPQGDPPVRFVDVPVPGPYARWEHRHRFLEAHGGTWVEDRVTYRLPLGPLGHAAHALVVRRQLAALWAYRDRRLAELLAPVSSPAG